ncbi:alpha/beta hydrolase [Devosia epidermidihirudinis]|uniref:Alpha/beta hydrolase n=1 Tax=Devosia epidermidihirudinis TaxID=1293439 RepID=A0A0F5QK69_9HYPH|nr:alpha/beta fold hydrolase [Devosia epidermidihirudinis]KKC41111.1 alpha/beta hydrolase [Devosia epidermidihirudinis]
MTSDLVLLPGLSCDERLWRDVIDQLGNEVRPLVADLLQDDSIAAMARRVLDAAPPRFALAGLSMGGYVALEIIRQAPERVTHLALLDTSSRSDTEARKEMRRAGMAAATGGKFGLVARMQLPDVLIKQHLDTPLADEVGEMTLRVGLDVYLAQQKAIMARIDSRPFLPSIAVPTLVGVGEGDMLTPRVLSEEMAELIPGAELVVFPDSAHVPTMENPDAVVAAMRAWLAR